MGLVTEESIVVTIPCSAPVVKFEPLECFNRISPEKTTGPDLISTRTPAIRWKEPFVTGDDDDNEEFLLHEPDLKRSPPKSSSLKSPTVTSQRIQHHEHHPSSYSTSILSTDPSRELKPLHRPPEYLGPVMLKHHSLSDGTDARVLVSTGHRSDVRRDEFRTQRMQSTFSVSLDDVQLLSASFKETVIWEEKDTRGEERTGELKKSWSFDDLSLIKEEIRKNLLSRTGGPDKLNNISLLPLCPSGSGSLMNQGLAPSPRMSLYLMTPQKLSRMTKQEVVGMWRESERELLNTLHDVIQEKKSLEERLLLLQRMLLKPP